MPMIQACRHGSSSWPSRWPSVRPPDVFACCGQLRGCDHVPGQQRVLLAVLGSGDRDVHLRRDRPGRHLRAPPPAGRRYRDPQEDSVHRPRYARPHGRSTSRGPLCPSPPRRPSRSPSTGTAAGHSRRELLPAAEPGEHHLRIAEPVLPVDRRPVQGHTNVIRARRGRRYRGPRVQADSGREVLWCPRSERQLGSNLTAGDNSWTWDGRNDNGDNLAKGNYFVRVWADDGSVTGCRKRRRSRSPAPIQGDTVEDGIRITTWARSFVLRRRTASLPERRGTLDLARRQVQRLLGMELAAADASSARPSCTPRVREIRKNGHTKTDTSLKVGGVGGPLSGDTAKITYSRPKAS